MKLRNGIAVLAAACAFSAAGVAGAGAAQAVGAPSAITAAVRGVQADQVSLQELLDLATRRVRAEFPSATLMLADGSSPTGPTRDMAEVTDWRLIYNTNDAASRIKSLQLYADLGGEISRPVYKEQPWGGVVAIRGQIGLSPELAYSILQDAGHGDAYQYVSLVKPLVANPQLQYHFSNINGGCDGFAVNVDDFAVNPICG